MSGRWTSRSTSSGCHASAARSASAPESASATTSKPSASSIRRALARKLGWSSTISTFMPSSLAAGGGFRHTASHTIGAATRTADTPGARIGTPPLRRESGVMQTTDTTGGGVMQAKGLAARAGRWSTEHRKAAIFGWLTFVVISLAIGTGIGSKKLEDHDRYKGESAAAEKAIVDAGMDPPAGESILVKSDRLTTEDPAFRAAMADVERRVQKVAVAENVRSGTTSEDGHAALVTFDVKGDSEKAQDHYDAVTAPVQAASAAHPGIEIKQFG